MSEFRVLVSCPLITDAIDSFADQFNSHGVEYDVVEVDQQLTEAELLEIIDGYDGVIAGDDEFTAEVLRSADQLSVIAKWGVGTDAIDIEAAEAEGIEVLNTPGAFVDEVADVVIGYAISLTRNLHIVDRDVRNGAWPCPQGVSLAGKTFGVVGVGNIGSAVARRAHAHGMDVVGFDVRPLPDELVNETGITAVTLPELFERSTVVSLNCALNEETRGLVGTELLDRLGSEGYLINTARGELVDQAALVDSLESGAVAGVGLDVFEEEPLPADSPLTDLDNVILGTHNAQNTREAVESVHRHTVDNLLSSLTSGSTES
ncbi:dihydrofolate reductase [Halorubrum sp. SD626R]|uniref:phosphoglycerate dehydrogenase n=1 Tax=Halorubrum sp. SD626R TaxID=1419722 RepID=UPI0010F4954D|nr:phosphoglycerate dehydrogenase [Halorubrum sp. SD626R]TKX79398.1 dihydrofolate reductase [Halorubrum sp. SD626R]